MMHQRASQMAQWQRICLPVQQTQETQVRSMGQEDPLEEGMATPSSIFLLENPMDRRAWQATIHGVSKSWTQLSTHDALTDTKSKCQLLSHVRHFATP